MNKKTNPASRIAMLLVAMGIAIAIHQTGCSSSKIPTAEGTDTLYTNQQAQGRALQVVFKKGNEHNYPLMAIWTTDTNNHYIETLYIAESIAKGFFAYGDSSTGKWQPGPMRRPAALPVWAHSRGHREQDGLYVPTQNTPMPDAISGATPQQNFVLNTKISEKTPALFYLYFEINQSWDWNEHWTNNKYPTDEAYKTSCQPALVYRTEINLGHKDLHQKLKLVGHSSHNGSSGIIYQELHTITTAKHITKSISVQH